MSSFIDKFLDLTATLPREIVRMLKLLKEVEERSKEINNNLQSEREKYLQKLKEKENKNNGDNESLIKIDKLHKELLVLSDYKQEIIKEIKYILEDSFLKKLTPIIQEGEKECQEQLIANNPNFSYNNNQYSNFYEKGNEEESVKKKKDENKTYLGNKTNRTKTIKNKKVNGVASSNEHSEEKMNYQEGDQQGGEIYCRCNRGCFGKMIECENPGCSVGWFHYGCVGISENEEPKEWYCSIECESNAKKIKDKNPKKKKKIHN